MRLLKQITILLLVFVLKSNSSFGQWVLPASTNASIQLSRFQIYIDNAEPAVLKTAARLLQKDIQTSCSIKVPIVYNWDNKAHQIILSSRKNRIQELGELASSPLISVPDTVWESGCTAGFLVAESGVHQILVSAADHGRTGSALGIYSPGLFHSTGIRHSPHVEYNYISSSSGSCQITAYFSPTLNLFNQPGGLRYAISIDDELPQIISINKEDTATGRGIWEKWVAENIIKKTSTHTRHKSGRHRIKVWFPDTGLVLQKLELQFGNPTPSYLGAPETLIKPINPLKP